MNLRSLLTINAILATLHGLGFVLLPSLMLAFYGVPSSPGAVVMGQLFGCHLLALGVLSWTAREGSETRPNMPVIWASLVSNPVGTVLVFWAIQNGSFGPMGWLGMAIYAGLALGYGMALRGLKRSGGAAPA